MRRLVAAAVVIVVAMFTVSCGSDSSKNQDSSTEVQQSASAHVVSPETQQKIVDDTRADFDVIVATGADNSNLSSALTGKALSDMKAQDAADKAAGKLKKHDYRNINVRYQDYAVPNAEVFAEFDDYGYYIDVATGAALDQPSGQHLTYALAVVEEGDRWKISEILSSSATNQATRPSQ